MHNTTKAMPKILNLALSMNFEFHHANNFETMVDIDLKVGKGKSKGNGIAVQTELALTEPIELAPFVGTKSCKKFELGNSEITSILMKPHIIAYICNY